MQIFLPIAEVSVNAFTLVALGGIVGLMSGLFGVGGGFLITPLLFFIGIPPAIAVATGANQVVASSFSGVLAHVKRKTVDFHMGWVLLAVFVTGTASYYRTDISRWMRPELRQVESLSPDAQVRAAEFGVAHLTAHAGGARSWFIGLPTPDSPVVDLFWRTRPGTPPGQARLDPATGAPAVIRDTKGGDFLYRFHFELSMPPLTGRWVVGTCALVLLVALISGIVTHRRIFADFFTFRRDKSAQRGWLDAHNVTGVLALPFHLMITYTGIVTLSVMYMPWGITTAYRGEAQTFFAESGQIPAPRPPAGQPGTGMRPARRQVSRRG